MGQVNTPQNQSGQTGNRQSRSSAIASPQPFVSASAQRKPVPPVSPAHRPTSVPVFAPAVYRPNVSSSLQPMPIGPAPHRQMPGIAPPIVYRLPKTVVAAPPPVYRPNFAAPLQPKPIPAASPVHWPEPAQREPISAIQLQRGRRSKKSSWNAKQIAQNERLFRRRAERQERYAREAEVRAAQERAQQLDVAQRVQELEQKFTETKGVYQGTLFSTTSTKANLIGQAWVGAGAVRSYYGASAWNSLVSSDGRRQYRPPMLKMSGQCANTFQANYEGKRGDGARFTFNAHATISDLTPGDGWNTLKAGQERPS